MRGRAGTAEVAGVAAEVAGMAEAPDASDSTDADADADADTDADTDADEGEREGNGAEAGAGAELPSGGTGGMATVGGKTDTGPASEVDARALAEACAEGPAADCETWPEPGGLPLGIGIRARSAKCRDKTSDICGGGPPPGPLPGAPASSPLLASEFESKSGRGPDPGSSALDGWLAGVVLMIATRRVARSSRPAPRARRGCRARRCGPGPSSRSRRRGGRSTVDG